jgi:hypothetical protein
VLALGVYRDELIAGGYFGFAGGRVSACWARWGCPYARGDVNCDGSVGFDDVNPFVLVLSNPGAFQQRYPDCYLDRADINGDGSVDFDDISPFVALLTRP